jgi:hypothetical protein
MAYGTVKIRVRPIRIAFLVDPADRAGVYRAIELSTFLWGGNYNPIIPSYRRTPAKWESHRVRLLPSPADIVTGYLHGFDPDLVVPVGKCATRSHNVGNRDIVKEEDLIGDLIETATPRHGIGLIELLGDFADKELKYKRNDSLNVAFPVLPRSNRLFLASVFGAVPTAAQKIIDRQFANVPGITKTKPTMEYFVELLGSARVFPRRLSVWALDERPLREATLYVCNATSVQDIIDYWNLRAAGYYVIPIPIQAAALENVKKLAAGFIEENYRPYRHNPKMFHQTIVQRSRGVSEETVRKFCDSLDISKDGSITQPKYSLRWWYPRLWDAWARENASEGIAFPYSHEEERRIVEGETRLELRSLDPKLRMFREYSGSPKYANEFSFSFYGSKEPMAEVFPEGSRELSSAIGRVGYPNWRFSKLGPVFLAHHSKDLIFLDLPRAEAVMTEWLRERGWKVSLSGPGRIAVQLLKQLGGTFGTSWLAHRGVIDLLGELEKEAGMPRQAVIGKLKQVIESDRLYFDAERFLERLLEVNAVRLGAKIQCPVCTRYNWYELNALEYELHCRFCLSDFAPPFKSPKNIEWTYRAHGPFASSIAQGSFTVLLTLRFLGRDHDHGITPLFSYKAEKDGKVLEADLTCLYKASTWRETRTHVVHAECKSFSGFEKRDLVRMKDMSEAFPGSALVFATLNNKLEKADIRMIQPLVFTEWRKRFYGKPYSPVIVLTGTELFSVRGISDCWKGKGGLYDQLSERSFELAELPNLADATQRLYLDLPGWYDWSEAKWRKQKQKRGQS